MFIAFMFAWCKLARWMINRWQICRGRSMSAKKCVGLVPVAAALTDTLEKGLRVSQSSAWHVLTSSQVTAICRRHMLASQT